VQIITSNLFPQSFCSCIARLRQTGGRPAMGLTTLALGAFAILVVLTATAGSAHAVNLVNNGSFEQTTCGYSCQINNSTLTDWTTNSGYAFLVYPGQATVNLGTGIKLWPGANCPPTCFPATSPDGGNFIAQDGAFLNGAEMQTITGLQVGHNYNVSFWQAAGQQDPYSGATTEQWRVSLGTDTQYSQLMNNASHDFVPWQQQTLTFQANATSEVLSFYAVGTPNGLPPFVLLDGVTLEEAPEPGAIILATSGLLTLGSSLWRRRVISIRAVTPDSNQ
jgi:hypothetical protein